MLHKLARKTWRYFEVYVSSEENWLPPDNFQEQPGPCIASRTSPTNIGMALLANLAAYDFGYCSVAQLLARTQHTLGTMSTLERFNGHFCNWYDTRTLKPLSPVYVSTVDSGNLAMNLLVLRQGLLEQIDAKIYAPNATEGLRDTAEVLCDAIRNAIVESRSTGAPSKLRDMLRQAETICAELGSSPRSVFDTAEFLNRLDVLATNMTDSLWACEETDWWTRTLLRNLTEHREEIAFMAPWSSHSIARYRLTRHGPDCGDTLDALLARLECCPTLRETSEFSVTLLPAIDSLLADTHAARSVSMDDKLDDWNWLVSIRAAVELASGRAKTRMQEIEEIANRCLEFADMDFLFLYDDSRDLLSIGYNISDHRLDSGYYDLLASEARAASYFAVAQGQLDQEHWFALRRMLTTAAGIPALLSWNGSMFEYLMPMLVMPTFENTLLDRTCRAIVKRQIDYGKQRKIPWGISESGYNTLDVQLNYQYRGFGVPGLGLKRGLVDDLVVAPYATVLALLVDPESSCRNLERLTADGRQGPYGFYEAIDYTPSRLPRGSGGVTIRSFMAHHEGMSLLALVYVLLDRPMQRRFRAHPAFRANELLLQESIPRTTAPVFPHAVEASTSNAATARPEDPMRIILDPSAATPEVHLLSNGRYHVMVNSAGSGFSRWRDIALTRWREDPTLDSWGTFCYIRDLDSGKFWSSGYQPCPKPTTSYEAIFAQAKAEYRRRDDYIETHTEISVSPEDDIELRRITFTNRSNRPRTIEVTTYAEVVLAPEGHDLSHPAFSNLFVQTELDVTRQAILCTRRPRHVEELPPWMFHLMTVQGESVGETTFETDRMAFIGRGRTVSAPAAMERDSQLTGSQGSVLDPIVSIRRTLVLPANASARVDLIFGAAETRAEAIALTEKYHDLRLADRVFELAWTHSQVELRHITASEADAQTYAKLAGAVIYAGPMYRSESLILMRNRQTQSGLWGHGISGDLPIVLVRIRDRAKLELIQQVFQAHAYWRMKGLVVDIIIWNEDDSVYRQELHETIMGLIAASPEAVFVDRPGGVFLRRGEQIPEADRVLLLAVARVVLLDDAGSLREQVERREVTVAPPPSFRPTGRRATLTVLPESPTYDLKFFNDFGGFTQDGREYIILLRPGQNTPAPWVNVIANAHFGTVVSESGSVYTWAENAHEYRMTPWGNDPVGAQSGEAFYMRDEETGRFWSPTAQPARGTNTYVVRHGFGYSIYEYSEDGIASELTIYVSMDSLVKYARLRVMNRSGRARLLSATGYWELVLGELRNKTRMHIGTEVDAETNAIFARNAYNTEFVGRIVFVDTSESNRTLTCDRTEFLGRNGSMSEPAALRRIRLSGRVGAGFDACAAVQVPIQLADGDEKIVVFTFGSAESEEEARQLVYRTRGVAHAQRALDESWQYWGRTLGVVHVETPDSALDILTNGWLTYQTLACRMWARSGFYQSGGAFGFRDQLQDAMALLHAEPRLLREQILRAAARQFREGDVQHWWHPQSGRGVRSRCSDDYLWLPAATCRYVRGTGDIGILDESAGLLESRPVHPEEEGYFDLPRVTEESITIYEHCVLALKYGLRFGAHGLPLMGTGDWNDGMNQVGAGGTGESVWLAFFLYDGLNKFIELAEHKGDALFAAECRVNADILRLRIEESSWDGSWYLRAFFDDGTPLGSASNEECQIDSIPQSWSVLSGAGEPGRAKVAMENAYQRLVDHDAQLIQLFDPPFDQSELNPGYIKGYGPGIRENGGQYTHAAVWVAMAFAGLGDSERLSELVALLNPINHSKSLNAAKRYRVEPYVIAADVYATAPHTGRGGWTWYTGSAGWMYRSITESLLGLNLEVDVLRLKPCIPASWPSYKIHYRYRETFYHITVNNGGKGNEVRELFADGVEQPELFLRLVDDRADHQITISLG